jgi:Leucine-rich repeat (LRR) protein
MPETPHIPEQAHMTTAQGSSEFGKPKVGFEQPPDKLIPAPELATVQAELQARYAKLQAAFEAAERVGDSSALADVRAQLTVLESELDQLERSIEWRDSAPERAEADLQTFIDYLKNQGLSDNDIKTRLGELSIYKDEVTSQIVIARADRQPFGLDLAELGLSGELPLPKQLLINRLDCYHNQLSQLPELPASLQGLYCSGNQLNQLPELPVSLQQLNCSFNQLNQLPELPASLQQLDCSSNQLNQLPELPASLQWLYCYNNRFDDATKAIIRARGFSY